MSKLCFIWTQLSALFGNNKVLPTFVESGINVLTKKKRDVDTDTNFILIKSHNWC